ncbi:MAG: SDR family NAD(P)-dependent oxidoreductase, partial [Acidobacteriota bacterium]
MTGSASFDLTGRVAIVTGGNGGIGRAIALGFAQAGAAVAIFGRNEEKNASTLAELEATGARAIAAKVDLTDRDGLEPAVRRVEAELGPVDILVNNAGIVSLSGGILQESPDSWDEVIEIQLNSVFLLSKIVAASMAQRE